MGLSRFPGVGFAAFAGSIVTLFLILGLNPQEGVVEIFGRSIKNYKRKDLAKTIAFVPQMFPADFPFSVTDKKYG